MLAKESIGKFLGPKSVPEIDHDILKCERSHKIRWNKKLDKCSATTNVFYTVKFNHREIILSTYIRPSLTFFEYVFASTWYQSWRFQLKFYHSQDLTSNMKGIEIMWKAAMWEWAILRMRDIMETGDCYSLCHN